MSSKFKIYKKDLEQLVTRGEKLHLVMQVECYPKMVEGDSEDAKKLKRFFEREPSFEESYQGWYSETKALIRQLLPDRLDDLVRHYQKPKPRKEISFENYRIEDYLQGLVITTEDWNGVKKTKVGTDAAIPHFIQQLAILKGIEARFESSLFDIKQIVQADILDSELDQSRELLKNGFLRGAGAIAGVVLEKHLGEVCMNHNLKSRKKHPTISDFNDQLKSSSILDVPTWRQIQRLGDLRNLCDHGKGREPTNDEIDELISGVDRITHSIF